MKNGIIGIWEGIEFTSRDDCIEKLMSEGYTQEEAEEMFDNAVDLTEVLKDSF